MVFVEKRNVIFKVPLIHNRKSIYKIVWNFFMKKYVYLGQSHYFKKGDEILINLSLFITLA